MRRLALYLGVPVLVVLSALVLLAQVSPWPATLALRALFSVDADRTAAALVPRLPQGLTEHLDLAYGPDPRERLDLFLPPGPPPPEGWPVLIWVHGGAFVAGGKEDVGNYLRLLAAEGYATIAPNYTRAPTARHPRPSAQMMTALLWMQATADRHALDPTRVILAGDSAGSHVALQTAIALHDPAYADMLGLRPRLDPAHLRGLVLFCGIFDPPDAGATGLIGAFLRSAAWAYLGDPDPAAAPHGGGFALSARLPASLPPLFISAGNADPLLPQSLRLAEQAQARGLATDTLFFPADHPTALGHEYQFRLTPDGEEALRRLLAFLARVTP